MKKETGVLSARVDAELHGEFKAMCAKRGLKIEALIERLARQEVDRYKKSR